MALTTQTCKYSIVIDFPTEWEKLESNGENEKIETALKALETYLTLNTREYAFILHDKDFNKDAEMEVKHLHAVYIKKSRTRVITEISNISKALYGDDEQRHKCLVSVQPMTAYEQALRYLCHVDDKDKYQYKIENLHTNLGQDFFTQLYEADAGNYINIDYIIDVIIESGGSLAMIYTTLGLNNAVHYRNVIKDLVTSDEIRGAIEKRRRDKFNKLLTEEMKRQEEKHKND